MAKQTIYVVDDEPLITRLAQINLERAGYAVEMAHDGVQALEALQQKQVTPDLILLDVMMPYMDGFELLKQLQADEELKRIPVIFLTARSRDDDMIMGQHLGAEKYLTKPINPTELLGFVESALNKSGE